MEIKSVATHAVKDYTQETVDNAIKIIIDNLGGIEKFVSSGQTVLLKPNLVTAMEPEKCATTHPAVVHAVAKLCKMAGAKVIIGDSPGGPYNKKYLNAVYKKTGMMDVANKLGVELNKDFSDTTIACPEGKVTKKIPVLGAINKADVIINIAKLKTHSFAGFSAACKNMYGAIPGLVKAEWHNYFRDIHSFSHCCHDINLALKDKIVLHITDGIDGMEGPGPTSGTPVHIGLLMASECYSSLDTAVARIMDENPSNLPTLSTAVERGLLNAEYSINIIGQDITPFVNPKFKRVPAVVLFKPSGSRCVNWLFKKLFNQKPVVSKRKCKGCNKCFDHCPAKAVIIKQRRKGGYVTFDLEKCIRCMCCQELCPFHLVKVKRTMLVKYMCSASRKRNRKTK